MYKKCSFFSCSFRFLEVYDMCFYYSKKTHVKDIDCCKRPNRVSLYFSLLPDSTSTSRFVSRAWVFYTDQTGLFFNQAQLHLNVQ